MIRKEILLKDRKSKRWRKIDLDAGRGLKIRVKGPRGRKWVTIFIGVVELLKIESSIERDNKFKGSKALLSFRCLSPALSVVLKCPDFKKNV